MASNKRITPNAHRCNRLIFIAILFFVAATVGCDKKAAPEAENVAKAPEVISEKWTDPLANGATLTVTPPATEGSPYTLTKTEHGWTIKSDQLGPQTIPLRSEYSQALNNIFSAPVTRVPKTFPSTDLSQVALVPAQRVKVELKDGATPPLFFYVGSVTEDPNTKESRTYILSGDGEQVFQAKNRLGDIFRHSPFELRNNEVLRLDPNKIIKMESDEGTQARYKLEFRDGKWVNMLHPEQALELSLINGIKRQLSPLSAIKYLPDTTDISKVPDTDKRTFIVSDSDGTTNTLQFVKIKQPEGAPLYLVKVINTGKVASVPETPASYAFLTSADLRERRPRTFPVDSIKEIRFPGTKPVVVRPMRNKENGEIQWAQMAPEKGSPIGIEHVQNAIEKAASILPVRMTDQSLEGAGLTPVDPTEILEIRLNDGTRKQLVFGKESERKDGRYVVWQDTTDVFVLSNADATRLHPGPDTFLK